MSIIKTINRKQLLEKKTVDEKIVSALKRDGRTFWNKWQRDNYIRKNCHIEHFDSGFFAVYAENKMIYSGGKISTDKTLNIRING